MQAPQSVNACAVLARRTAPPSRFSARTDAARFVVPRWRKMAIWVSFAGPPASSARLIYLNKRTFLQPTGRGDFVPFPAANMCSNVRARNPEKCNPDDVPFGRRRTLVGGDDAVKRSL